jgi:hypothetical protein
MDWFHKKWIVEDEEGELEFLSALFGTNEVICTDEDVSTFHVIHIAGLSLVFSYSTCTFNPLVHILLNQRGGGGVHK